MNSLRAIHTAIRRTIFTRLIIFTMILAVVLAGTTSATAATPTPSSTTNVARPVPPTQYPTRESDKASSIVQAASDATDYGIKVVPRHLRRGMARSEGQCRPCSLEGYERGKYLPDFPERSAS